MFLRSEATYSDSKEASPMYDIRRLASFMAGAVAIAGLALWPAASARAADAGSDGKSWILDSNNWQQAEGMLPPVVLERVKKGDYWYKVVPVDPEEFKQNYSKKFW